MKWSKAIELSNKYFGKDIKKVEKELLLLTVPTLRELAELFKVRTTKEVAEKLSTVKIISNGTNKDNEIKSI